MRKGRLLRHRDSPACVCRLLTHLVRLRSYVIIIFLMKHSGFDREHSSSGGGRGSQHQNRDDRQDWQERQDRQDWQERPDRQDKQDKPDPAAQRYKMQETCTLMLQAAASALPNSESVFTDLSISIGTSVPDEVQIQGTTIFVRYPSVQAATSVYDHLQGEMQAAGRKLKVQYYPIRKVDLTVAYDWYCQKCDYKNFARRGKCYRCESDKTPTCKLCNSTQASTRPFRQESAENCSLMLRGPVLCELEESCLLELFQTIAPVRDVRQIKNKLAGGFKDFAFIEFFTPEETSIAYREASDPSFRIAGQRVNANYSRNKSDDDYFKPLPYEIAKRERRIREKPTLENNYYHLQKQKEMEQEKARPAITMEQLKEKHEQELKKHQPAQKEMTEEQSRRRKAEQLSRQWEREMKTQVTMYICAACDRKFQNAEEMKVHEKMSKLHVFNLARLSKTALSL